MNSEAVNFGNSVGSALEQAAQNNIHPMDAVLCLGGYIDIAIRCAGGTNQDSARIFHALSAKYANVLPPNITKTHPVYEPCSKIENTAA